MAQDSFFQNKAFWAQWSSCLSPLAMTNHFSSMDGHELLSGPQAQVRLRSWDRLETPATGVTAPVPFSGISGGKQGGGKSNYSPSCLCKEVGNWSASQEQSALGAAARTEPS